MVEFNSEEVDHKRLMEIRAQFGDDSATPATSERPAAHAAPDSHDEPGNTSASFDFSAPRPTFPGGISIPEPSLAAKYGLPAPGEQKQAESTDPAPMAADPGISTHVDVPGFTPVAEQATADEAADEAHDEPDYLSATDIYSSAPSVEESKPPTKEPEALSPPAASSGFTPIGAPLSVDAAPAPQPAAPIVPQEPVSPPTWQHQAPTPSSGASGNLPPYGAPQAQATPGYPQQPVGWQAQPESGYGPPEYPVPVAPPPDQAYSPQPGYPQQAPQPYPPQHGYPQQFSQPGYPQQGQPYAQQQPGYPPQQHPGQSYPPQPGYPQQPGQSYPQQPGYPQQATPQPGRAQPAPPQQSGWRAAVPGGRAQGRSSGQQQVPAPAIREEDTASTTLTPQETEYYQPEQASYQDSVSPGGGGGNVTPKGGKPPRPTMGWRSMVAKATGASITKGAFEVEYDMDVERINVALGNCKKIGFASFKGGVGKTVSAMCISSVLADLISKGQVTLIDTVARGTAATRIAGKQTSNIKAFAAAAQAGQLGKDSQVDQHMLNNKYRLSVLGADQSYLNGPLTPEEYYAVLDRLEVSQIVIGVDMDPSTSSLGYREITESLDALVLVTDIASDALGQLYHHFGWLRAQGFDELTRRTVVLFNHRSKGNKDYIDLRKQVLHFEQVEHCQGRVFEIPWDRHLSEAGPIELDLLDKGTHRQYVKAAAQAMQVLPRT